MTDIEIIREVLTWMDHFAKRHIDRTIENVANNALAAIDRLSAPPSESARDMLRELDDFRPKIGDLYREDDDRAAIVDRYIRSHFPPPTESARELVDEIDQCLTGFVKQDEDFIGMRKDRAATLIESSWARVREECAERAVNHIRNSYDPVIGSQVWTENGLRAAILAQSKEERYD